MNGITYFKLKSQYEGDYTKNCSLSGSEVDNNFFTLEGRDVKSVHVDNGEVVLHLINGEKLSTHNLTEKCIKNLDFSFDEINGVLTITQNNVTKKITGFATNYNIGQTTSVDNTLVGNGLSESPIGLSPIVKTGQYRPVKAIVDKTKGEKLPFSKYLLTGDRYLTKETINSYGLLYNYEAVKRIACALKEQNSQWRIPTKEDWDDMLNAVEPLDDFRNHELSTANKYLGRYAGAFLKSKEGWAHSEKCHNFDEIKTCVDYSEEYLCKEHINEETNLCHHPYCGEHGNHIHHKHKHDNNGLDKYGFNIVPSGIADDGCNFSFFKERAYFWTATNSEFRNAYVKTFIYDKSSVLQDILASGNHFSLRLVKDYKGDNYNEREEILDNLYSTVLMPSVKHGKAIWTSVNISEKGCGCDHNYLIPNNNQGISNFNIVKYFINEWDGKEWKRKELLDGESVVLIKEEKLIGGKTIKCYTELRNENGDIIDVTKKINSDVVDSFEGDMNIIKDDIKRIDEKLSNAMDEYNNKDIVFDEKINELYQKVNENKSLIDKEVERSTEKDYELENRIEQISDDLKSIESGSSVNLDKIEEKIDNEIERAKKEEQNLKLKTDEIEGKLLTNEGSEFNLVNGVLTLKSNDETNNIKIQFNMNFGEF